MGKNREKEREMEKEKIPLQDLYVFFMLILFSGLVGAIIQSALAAKTMEDKVITVTVPTKGGSFPVRMTIQSIPEDSGLTPKSISEILNGPFEAAIHGFGPHDEEYRAEADDDNKSISALLSEEKIKSPERAAAPQ